MNDLWLGRAIFLLHGLAVTAELALLASALTLPIALLVGYGRIALPRYLAFPLGCYVELFRGTSALVQMFWVYYVLPLLGLTLPAMLVGILVLGLNAGAYGSEVVRGAVGAIPREQVEAATALNLSKWQTAWRIVLPQAIPAMLPPFGNILIELLKNTSLVSLITISELTFSAQIIRAESLHTVILFSSILVLYYVLASGIAMMIRRLELGVRKTQGVN